MFRAFLLALVLIGSVSSTSLAQEDKAVLNPGRDAQAERSRRDAPFSPWGLVPWLAFSISAGWASRRALLSGQSARSKGLILVTGLLVGGSAGELMLRLTSDDWAMHVKVRDGCYHDNPRGYFEAMTYLDDPETRAFCAGPLSDVWAGCEAASPKKVEGRERVLALGDSFTDGVGVFAKDAWPAQLDRVLGGDVEVVNCGKAASFTSHTAKRYLSHRERHQPDTVIYAFVLNDVPLLGAAPLDGTDIAFQLPNRQAYKEALQDDGLWGPLIRHSAIARLVMERWITWQVHDETLKTYLQTYSASNEAAFVEAMDLVGAMNTLVTEGQGQLLVAIWPLLERLDDYPFKAVHQKVSTALEARGVAVLDLLPTFIGRDETGLHVHPTDHHPNEHAHQLAAEAIASALNR